MSSLCYRLILCLPLLSADAPLAPLGRKLDDCELGNHCGMPQRLSDFCDSPILALVFLGTECPLAGLYAERVNELDQEFGHRGVRFLGIDANQQDSAAEIDAFAKTHALRFP